MQDESNQNKHQMINPQYLLVNNDATDEQNIDIMQLLATLYNKKWFIAKLTTLFIFSAVIIALYLPRTYQVKSHLVEANENNYQSLLHNADLNISQTNLFMQFIKILGQKGNVISYLQDSSKIGQDLDIAAVSSAKARIALLNKKALNYTVSVINHYENDPKDNFQDNSREADLTTMSTTLDLNATDNKAYIDYTNKKVWQAILNSQRSKVQIKIIKLEETINIEVAKVRASRLNEVQRLQNNRSLAIANLSNEIEALTKRDFRDRQLRLVELENALKIAQVLGVAHSNQTQEIKSLGVAIDINQKKSDLYLKGALYLEKEIDLTKAKPHTLDYEKRLSLLNEKLYILQNNKKISELKNRQDDKPYTKNIEKNLEELKRLKALSFDISGASSFAFGGMPQVETSAIKPEKRLIVIIGAIIGLMLSSFIVLIQSTVSSRREMELK